MRVAQMIDSLYVGGAERMQLTYAQAAIARGETPTVIVLAHYAGTPIPDQLRALGARVVEITGRSLLDRERFARLVAFLRAERFDVLHVHLTYAILLGAAVGLVTRTRVVASLHNTQPDRHGLLELIVLYFGVRRIIAVGDAVADAYRKRMPGRKIQTILNPVQPGAQISASERISLRKELLGDERRKLIVGVGRLEPQKAWIDLLSAMNILRTARQDATLLIAGQGTLRDELQNRINELGLRKFVRLIGIRDDVPRLLAVSDLFVSASHWEGLPVAILEAMAAALPVVATRVGDVPNVVTPQTGLLVDARQPAQLARAMQEILDDLARAERMGAAGRLFVNERHSPQRWLDSLYQVYSQQ